jgi:UDP-N-acetylmuramate--alanine ligase
MLEQGMTVSGSDIMPNVATLTLAAQGARIYSAHAAENVRDADLVVVSSAVHGDNPEWTAALAQHIPVVKRDALVGAMMQDRTGIAVAGTAGKTTTTAMVAYCLSELGCDPTFIVGGVLANYETNARAGKGPHFVVEADEYDRMFLGLTPKHAIVTNVEFDHPDFFADEADVVRAFQSFVSLPGLRAADSIVLLCGDDRNARALRSVAPGALAYGFGEQNDYRIIDPHWDAQRGAEFVVASDRRSVAVVLLRLPGRHNMLNACAVIALCHRLKLDMTQVTGALSRFEGTHRRFEIIAESHGVTIVDDYAHHPTKIRATLSAARERFEGRKLWVVFQPHTYSRTRALMDEFAQAFTDADEVVITDIFPARETDTLGVSGAQLAARVAHLHKQFAATLDEAAAFLEARLAPGDVLILLGAGDVNTLAARLWQVIPPGRGSQASGSTSGRDDAVPSVRDGAAPSERGGSAGSTASAENAGQAAPAG